MGRESEESSLPTLQHLMLHEGRTDIHDPPRPFDSHLRQQFPQAIRRTASMDLQRSPRRRITSSSLFNLLNDDPSTANATTTPPRSHGNKARIPRSCSPDETPRASDVSRFGSSTHFLPRNPVMGASPPQPAGQGYMAARQDSIPSHLPPPPYLRKGSDPLSEAESSFSGYSDVETPARRSFSTTSSTSSMDDHELHFRPMNSVGYPRLSHDDQRLTPPEKRSPDSFFSASYSSVPRAVATPGSSRAPISRTTKACNACRSRKVRCDAGGQAATLVGNEMPCSRCKDAGLTCVYSAQQRKRGPTPGSRRGESTTKNKRGGEGNETPSRRPSAITTHRPSHAEDDPTITMRMLSRPTPYRSASISTYSHAPSVFDSRAPQGGYPYHHDMHPPPPPHDNMYPSPTVPSPTWTHSFTSSSASTSPNTPYLPTWSQMGMPTGTGPLATPPLPQDDYAHRPESPAIMGWAGSGAPGGKNQTPPERPSYSTQSSTSARSSAEEEAFRNGYTMAFAQFQRQKEIDLGQEPDMGSVRLPPISVGTGR